MKNAQLGLYSRAIAVALSLFFTTPSLFANKSKETDSSTTEGISKKEENIIDPGCNGSILKYNYNEKNLLLLTNINNQNERKEIVIRYSEDEGVNWSSPKVIYDGEAAYSSMTQLGNGDVGIFYEANNYTSNIFKSLSIDWILSTE